MNNGILSLTLHTKESAKPKKSKSAKTRGWFQRPLGVREQPHFLYHHLIGSIF